MVKRKIEFYNLDAIISVGFRVNTKRGIEFRQWANKVLKEYLLRDYVVDAYAHIVSLIKQARTSIVLVDNYIDETTLTMLSRRNAGVTATVYTRQLTALIRNFYKFLMDRLDTKAFGLKKNSRYQGLRVQVHQRTRQVDKDSKAL